MSNTVTLEKPAGGYRWIILSLVFFATTINYLDRQVISLLKVADIGLNLVKPVDHGHRLAQPRKLFEYLAAGVPVVGADVPSIAEVIAKWRCGLAVDCASPSAIAAAILRLALDPDERRRCAANALRAAREEYCWEAQEPRFLEVFQRLGGPAPARPQSPPAP